METDLWGWTTELQGGVQAAWCQAITPVPQLCHTATEQETPTPPAAQEELLCARCWERGADGRTHGGHDSSPVSWESSSVCTASARLGTSVKSEGSCQAVGSTILRVFSSPEVSVIPRDSVGGEGGASEGENPAPQRTGEEEGPRCCCVLQLLRGTPLSLGWPQLPPATGFWWHWGNSRGERKTVTVILRPGNRAAVKHPTGITVPQRSGCRSPLASAAGDATPQNELTRSRRIL